VKKLPEPVKHYLQTLDAVQRADGYLCLNDAQDIIASDGWVGTTNLGNINRSQNPVISIPVLEGLLPGNASAPTVITNAHIDHDYYFDIHLFHNHTDTWVLFIDKTRSAKLLQKEQQIRLTDDFNNDKRQSGN